MIVSWRVSEEKQPDNRAALLLTKTLPQARMTIEDETLYFSRGVRQGGASGPFLFKWGFRRIIQGLQATIETETAGGLWMTLEGQWLQVDTTVFADDMDVTLVDEGGRMTELADKGVNARVVQALARHKHLNTTMRYIELNEHKLRNAIELI